MNNKLKGYSKKLINPSKILNSYGFTAIEMVMVIAVLSVLSVAGVATYTGFYKYTKVSATENAADTVYDLAYIYLIDNNPNTSPIDAEIQFNAGEIDFDEDIPDSSANLSKAIGSNFSPFALTSELNGTMGRAKLGAQPASPSKNSPSENDEVIDSSLKIVVKVEIIDEYRVKVVARYQGTNISATRETPPVGSDKDAEGTLGEGIENPSDGQATTPETVPEQTDDDTHENNPNIPEENPVEKDEPTLVEPEEEIVKTMPSTYDKNSLSRLTYQCKTDKTGYLGVLNIASGTEVFWKKKSDNDSSATFVSYVNDMNNFVINNSVSEQVKISNHSENLTLQKDVIYEAIVLGDFQVLSSPGNSKTGDNLSDCLISTGTLGDHSGIEYITYLSADSLTKIPSSIPSTVKSLQGAFNDARIFNDQSIVSWNTSNVQDMSYLFKNAENFNQPIGSWNTGNVIDMSGMFEGAKSFDQEVRGWDVKDVVSMKGMFKNATTFNQSFNSWTAKSVRDTSSMFEGATSFNQDMPGFHMHNVINMSQMFKNATVFNGKVGSWQTKNVQNMNEMFYNARSFNQNIKSWDVSNVSEKTDFATGSALKSNALPKF